MSYNSLHVLLDKDTSGCSIYFRIPSKNQANDGSWELRMDGACLLPDAKGTAKLGISVNGQRVDLKEITTAFPIQSTYIFRGHIANLKSKV